MDYKDYYAVMGVSPDADAKEIKTAYRRLARKYHPDISKEANAEAKFKEISESLNLVQLLSVTSGYKYLTFKIQKRLNTSF